jgi:hypothetical protein
MGKKTDNNRTESAHERNLLGGFSAKNGYTKGAFYFLKSLSEDFWPREGGVFGLHIRNPVAKDLRIGFAKEGDALLGKAALEVFVVFYDAIMDEHDFFVEAEVGMGIDMSGGAMSGPARMSNPRISSRSAITHRFLKGRDLAALFANEEFPIRSDKGKARRVIAPIL